MTAPPTRPAPVRPVQYKGEVLDAERGPGLGCFRFQLVLLLVLVVLTPISVLEDWPAEVSAGLLFLTIALLLVAGQTIIFLLRLVAADRAAGRRRPMASATRTVGQLEDDAGSRATDAPSGAAQTTPPTDARSAERRPTPPADAHSAEPRPAPPAKARSREPQRAELVDAPSVSAQTAPPTDARSAEPRPAPPDMRQ